ncbi:hypothetical protein [Streptomyces lydicus]|uniref:hypothetical protein n=1 Tax=Streptomyces lydicus TaxID=47763 RepID=UPI0036E94B1B
MLLRKRGALDRSEALHQARAEGTFTAEHEAFWAMAQQQLGEIEGMKALEGRRPWSVRFLSILISSTRTCSQASVSPSR